MVMRTRDEPPQVADHATPSAQTEVRLSFREYLTSSRTAVGLITASVFAMFVSVVIVPYAFADDYSLLWMAVSGQANPQFGSTITAGNAAEGRPLAGALLQFLYSAAGSIADLRYMDFSGCWRLWGWHACFIGR